MMNECVRRREQHQLCGKDWSALDKLMISPLESKVKRSRCLTVSKLTAGNCDHNHRDCWHRHRSLF